MANGLNAAKRKGDYWSRRCPGFPMRNRYGKQLTHRYERRHGKRLSHLALHGVYEGDGEWLCWHCMDEEGWGPCVATVPPTYPRA